MSWTSGLQLKVVEGQERGRTIRLDHPEVTLGRAQTKGERAPGWIFFNEPTVSRVHAILSWDDSRKHYILNHRSKTNASLVNGSPVDHHPITIGTRLQLGLLVLEMQSAEAANTARSGRLGDAVTGPEKKKNESVVGPILEALSNLGEEKPAPSRPSTGSGLLKPPTKTADGPDPWSSFNTNASASANPFRTLAPPAPAPPDFTVLEPELEDATGASAERPAAFRLIVAEGPDKGRRFPLLESVLIIGRSLGSADPRMDVGVLLQDDELPSEQAMLVWQGREQAYGILQADGTSVEIRVRRTVNGAPRELRVGRDAPVLLQEGDVLQMGKSVLILRRADGQGSRRSPAPAPARSPFRPSVQLAGPQSSSPAELDTPEEDEPGWEASAGDEVRTPHSLVGDGPAYPGGVPAFSPASDDPWSNAASIRPPAPPAPLAPLPPAPEARPAPPRTAPVSPPAPEPDLPDVPKRPVEPTFLGPTRPGSPRRPVSLAETAVGASSAPPAPPAEPLKPPRSIPPLSTAMRETVQPGQGASAQVDLAEMGTIGTSPKRTAPEAAAPPQRDPSGTTQRIQLGSLMESPIGEDLPDLGALTWPWRFRADYVFDYLKGTRRGCQISLVGAEMTEDRVINIGCPGERLNDIEVGGQSVTNSQAQLRFRTGRFSLLNQGPPDVVFINRVPMKTGDQVVLVTGDLIETGDTQVRFLERRVVETLSSYLVEVESGVDADQGRQFHFNKQRVLIGRGKNCDIHLNDLEVSRLHACLVYRDGRFYLQHRSDTNPTFVNGMSVLPGSERMITPDDRIRLSSLTVLRFVLKGMPAGPNEKSQPGSRGLTRK
ncbi:MAG: hypothetical protein AMXMBFR33_71040 [Candidatus Xenobia bacterium]